MTAPTSNASFYADFGSLAALKRDAKADGQKTLRAAAQQFESLFTDMMLKSMRAASVGDALTGGDEVEFYQGMFDQQLAVQLSKGKGLGLADMLVQQLTRSGLVPGGSGTGASVEAMPDNVTTASGAARVSNAGTGMATIPTGAPAGATGPDTAVSYDGAIAAPERVGAEPQPDAISLNWPPATPEEFVQRLLPHAQQAAKALGVDPATLVAHAALETGWGRHVPSNADGSSSFNLFGIKASSTWQGNSISAGTLEHEQGVTVKRVERFKSYGSPAECFSDYASLLGGANRYQSVRNSGGNAARFAQGLQQGGYATDPQYSAKLRTVAAAVTSIQAGLIQAGDHPADT